LQAVEVVAGLAVEVQAVTEQILDYLFLPDLLLLLQLVVEEESLRVLLPLPGLKVVIVYSEV
jgi:hypothetical protein